MRWILMTKLCIVLCIDYANGKSTIQKTDDTGTFWHVTDFHYDIFYGDGAYPVSSCRTTDPLGKWGSYHCDSPWALINSSVYAMKGFAPDPDFIVWTGDDYPHVPGNRKSEELLLNVVYNLTNLLMDVFPDTAVFPVLGNHDYNPTNQMPPRPNSIYQEISEYWDSWLGRYTGVLESFQNAAYYTTLDPISGFRIVGMNTVYYYKDEETKNDADPANQFQWLEDTLTAARANGEKVLIIGHVTPGGFERHAGQYWFTQHEDVEGVQYDVRYYQIIQQYYDVIAGQLYGHQHTDSFKLFYSQNGDPVSAVFVCPAVTPWNTTLGGVGANNPGIRLFKYNKNDGTLLDWEQFYLDLSKVVEEDAPVWESQYQASESYNLDDLSPTSMHKLVESFQADDSPTFDRYYLHNSVNYDASKCSGECKEAQLCAITEVDRDGYTMCLESSAFAIKFKITILIFTLLCVFSLS
ncbi:acid sphingomyelinase-like phosphodiesterase 3b [Amphiura filiformis]|uniref:acid sphingomyelinase-like phosphodiesterase 3b n=1 Tax=Amphiura filiformis TaxID=82378 RepID=UPI003B20DA5F